MVTIRGPRVSGLHLVEAYEMLPRSIGPVTFERFEASRFKAMNYVVIFEKSATGWGARS